jgi:hypothetical protein
MCEGPAAIDVGDEDDGCPGRMGRAHVCEVGRAEICLGRAACAFDEDEVVLGEEVLQRGRGDRPELPGPVPPPARSELVVDLPHHDHLAAVVSLRLDEDRVHPHVRLDPGGERLQVLGDAHLAAGGDACVVRHVLRLERRDAYSATEERPRERGRHDALSGGARDTLDRESAHRGVLEGTIAMRPPTSTTSIVAV